MQPVMARRRASASVSATRMLRTMRQSLRSGVRPVAAGAGLHRRPVAGQVAAVQVQAHRQEAPFAGQLQGVGAGAEAGHPDRRVRLLNRLQEGAEDVAEHRLGPGDLPVLALHLERRVGGPQAQDHVQRLAHHRAGVRARQAEGRLVGGDGAGGDAEVDPPAGDVVEQEIRSASAVGWWNGSRKPPGPSRMRLVWAIAWEIRMSGAGFGSHGTVWCSPTQASA